MSTIINIYHNDWYGECIIFDKNKIIRKDIENEEGKYIINKNKLIIYWEKWDDDIFYTNDYLNYYLYDNIQSKFSEIFLLDKNKQFKCIIDFKSLVINIDKTKLNINLEKDYLFVKENNYKIIKYKKISNYFYVKYLDYNKYFLLDIFYETNKKYLFNKNNLIFYDVNNLNDYGKYKIDNNLLKLHYNDEKIINFYTNSFYQEVKNYNNVKVLKPNSIFYDNKVLFSNISLCNNQIILTSIYYLYHPWNFDELKINIKNNKIIKKNNFLYENYESCSMIILDLQYVNNNEEISIKYKDKTYEINLTQLNLEKNNIYCMTLFKDDYQLLDKYLEYYSMLGVDSFLIYYNDIIDDELIKKINAINKDKYNIYIFEWNFHYWWKHLNNPKHHHSQTMAINDSLNILKNYSNYILYNDLDEYIKLDKGFNNLIENNKDIDIFQFKCRFCKMGNDKIKYSDFKKKYNENNIILGNFWEKFREKNLIKCKKFNIFGIHEYIVNYTTDDNINLYDSGFFYHFLNFEEKFRPELMTQYIS